MIEISDRIESGEILSLDEAKGIVGRSLFLDIPYFKYTKSITVEYMHGTCLGVIRHKMKILLKRTLSFHCCKATIYFSPKDTTMECNSYVYTFKGNEYHLYKIVSIEDDTFECNIVEIIETMFPETPTLNWGKVGVFKSGEIKNEIQFIQRQEIAEKINKVQNLFITCPNNILEEK